VVSPVAQHCRQPWATACSPPWISPASQRSFRIPAGYFTRCCPREHTGWNVPPWDQRKPHHFACMRICIRAWPASLGCPSTGFSHPACSWTGRESISSLTSRSAMYEVENLSTSYMRSMLHEKDRFVNRLGMLVSSSVFSSVNIASSLR
jgi:hypothetical protein